MRLAVRFDDGSLRPAILLMANGTRMRASLRDCDDAVEFRLDNGHWLDEAGNVVEIQFDLPDRKFAKLVQESDAAGYGRSAALDVHFWSPGAPKRPSVLRVN